MCDRPEELIEAFRQAAILHGMETANFATLGCMFDTDRTRAIMLDKEDRLRDYLYNGDKAEENKGFILPEDEELDDLVEEFLDYVGYFGLNRGAGLHFDTRIETLKRDELEHLVREFVRFAKGESPDPDRMRKMQMGEDVD